MEAIPMARTGDTTHAVTDQALQEFRAFFRTYTLRVERFLVNQGATRHDAEDATQQAMHDLYRRWTLIRQPRAWIFKAAKGHFLRSVDRQRREQLHDDMQPVCDDAATRTAWNGMPPRRYDLDGGSEETQWVIARLQQLPPAQRQVMALKIDGYEAPEIADMIGSPAETVRSNIRYARARLTQVLQADLAAAPAHAGGSHAEGRTV
ncbi:RNA polymerase sigma factor [Micromonospora sp. NPDC023888]|uniref:RNA polymerase sigma factor n=1 Tax=Micromonospora sp. NPDC023888 TaxID=3155607 RepID=UPI0033D4001A